MALDNPIILYTGSQVDLLATDALDFLQLITKLAVVYFVALLLDFLINVSLVDLQLVLEVALRLLRALNHFLAVELDDLLLGELAEKRDGYLVAFLDVVAALF